MTPRHLTLAAALALPALANAVDYYDGKHTLLCTVHEIHECNITTECTEVSAEQIDAPPYFHVDFKNKRLVTTAVSAVRRESAILSFDTIDEKLFLQGREDGEENVNDGVAWTLSIADPDGTMAFSGVRNDSVIAAFGACVPID